MLRNVFDTLKYRILLKSIRYQILSWILFKLKCRKSLLFIGHKCHVKMPIHRHQLSTELWQCPKRFLTADMASRRFFERRLSGLLWRHLKTNQSTGKRHQAIWRHWENLGKPIRAQESDAKPKKNFGRENSKNYQLFMRKKSIKYFYLILKISIRYRYWYFFPKCIWIVFRYSKKVFDTVFDTFSIRYSLLCLGIYKLQITIVNSTARIQL